jgi:hypothetical protein
VSAGSGPTLEMAWIAWIVVGAIAGVLASKIVASREGLVVMVVFGSLGLSRRLRGCQPAACRIGQSL